VGEHCETSRRHLNPDWTYCAFCGADTRPSHGARAVSGKPPVRLEIPGDSAARPGERPRKAA
jgi:hypothetical protein